MNKPHGEFSCVFDVGANTGQFGQRVKGWWPDAKLHSFEPLPDVALELVITAGEWEDWQTYPVGLSDEPKVSKMWRNDTTVCSSVKEMADLHKQAFPFSKDAEEVECLFDTLDSYVHLIQKPALLKVDVQGGELEVLKGGREALKLFDAVLLEVSWKELYLGSPTFDELNDFLEPFGFNHSYRLDKLEHPGDGSLLQSDEVWER